MTLPEIIEKVKKEAKIEYLNDPEKFHGKPKIIIKVKNDIPKELAVEKLPTSNQFDFTREAKNFLANNISTNTEFIVVVNEVQKKSKLVNPLGENVPIERGIMITGKDFKTGRTICHIVKCIDTRDVRDESIKSIKPAEEIIGETRAKKTYSVHEIQGTQNLDETKTYDIYSKFGAEEILDSEQNHDFVEHPILTQLFSLTTIGRLSI